MRIALLEDEPDQAAFAIEALTSAGHVCREFSRGSALLHELRRQSYDLLILDWMPDMSGAELVSWVRKGHHAHVPVIFVTDHGHENDVASILDAGADDYVIKPVAAHVLVARVSSLLRRAYRPAPANSKVTFGDYEFDPRTERVLKEGTLVSLTPHEFALALLLFQNLGRPLSREHIREVVWRQHPHVVSRTIDTYVYYVRTKLDLRERNGYRLGSIRSYGYRLEQIGDASAADRQSQFFTSAIH